MISIILFVICSEAQKLQDSRQLTDLPARADDATRSACDANGSIAHAAFSLLVFGFLAHEFLSFLICYYCVGRFNGINIKTL